MTTFEERIVDGIKEQIDKVPDAPAGQIPEAPSRVPRIVYVAAALAALVSIGLFLPTPRQSEPQAAATGFLLEMANGLEVPVIETPIATLSGRTVYRGAGNDELLAFEPPGLEQPLVQRSLSEDPTGGALGQAMGPIIYLGDNGNTPVLMWVQPSFSIIGPVDDWIASALDNTEMRVSIQGGIIFPHPGDDRTYFDVQSNITVGEPSGREDYISWVGLPEEAAVVVAELGDVTYWQRPVASSATFIITGQEAAGGTLTAYSSDGEVLSEMPIAGLAR